MSDLNIFYNDLYDVVIFTQSYKLMLPRKHTKIIC